MTPVFENISKGNTLNIFSFSTDYFKFYWHFHKEYEITLILEGQGKRYIGNNSENFHKHDLIFIGSKIPHTWKSEPIVNSNVKALVFHFTDEVFKPIIDLPEFIELKKWLSLSAFGLSIRVNDKILKKMQNLEKLSGSLQIIRFYELLLLLHKQKSKKILEDAYEINYSNKNQRIDFVLNYILHHYQDLCKIEEVASLVHLTKSGFSKFFKIQMGICYSQYINELRIKEAKKLLVETDFTIYKIYSKVGFENQAYFNRIFKKLTNLSPKEYRKYHWKND